MALVTERREKSAAIITFANPPRGYMNAAQVSELGGLIENIETDASVRTVIFTGGVPGVFIRHYDVGDILEAAGAVRKSSTRKPPDGFDRRLRTTQCRRSSARVMAT